MMRTIRLDLAYDGTGFRGWARQRDQAVRTVEGILADELERVIREPVRLSVAGRTDAGVHARGQVASFVTSTRLPPTTLQRAVNGRLAPEVVVVRASVAAAGFDARLSASARTYGYVIDTGDVPNPFTARAVWHRPGDLSVPRMRVAAGALIGEHDFASFCRRNGKSTVRRLQRLTIRRDAIHVRFGLRANAFCHQMVRSIVGTLVATGEGRIEPADIARILNARDRSTALDLVPPRGLTLEHVSYGRRNP